MNGTFTMQKEMYIQNNIPFDESAMHLEAQDMYARMFAMKFLPPGRGLWAMGTSLTRSRRLYAALNNCAFVSTSDLSTHPMDPFCFLMDASMLGVGVGFDTRGAGTVVICDPPNLESAGHSSNTLCATTPRYSIDDSREGWVESLRVLLMAFFQGTPLPQFDYSHIRPAGSPIKGFGGTSQGHKPLQALHDSVIQVLQPLVGKPITATAIVDIMNLVGRCVVAGNVRRTAEIAFGDPNSDEYIALKDYSLNPHRAEYGWTSNNSVFAELGMDYSKICDKIRINGEPGIAWLQNMRAYGRMASPPSYIDILAAGGNPCLEQTLESYEICCLVETFPAKHESKEDFLDTLKCAFTYAKTVTLGATHWPKTNHIMQRNRRIGASMSGIAQFVASRGIHELHEWCHAGYKAIQQHDDYISSKFRVPQSIKTTSIKPSGTVSLLAGATPGMHFPESRYYIRRVRMAETSSMIPSLVSAGYHVEKTDEPGTVVVEFPIDAGEGVRTLDEVSMWEQLGMAAFLQKHWADNQVSCTVTFDPKTEGPQLQHALDLYQYDLKGVSFLPRVEMGAYKHMPYEAISKEKYEELHAKLRPLDLSSDSSVNNDVPDKFCDAAGCSISIKSTDN